MTKSKEYRYKEGECTFPRQTKDGKTKKALRYWMMLDSQPSVDQGLFGSRIRKLLIVDEGKALAYFVLGEWLIEPEEFLARMAISMLVDNSWEESR